MKIKKPKGYGLEAEEISFTPATLAVFMGYVFVAILIVGAFVLWGGG